MVRDALWRVREVAADGFDGRVHATVQSPEDVLDAGLELHRRVGADLRVAIPKTVSEPAFGRVFWVHEDVTGRQVLVNVRELTTLNTVKGQEPVSAEPTLQGVDVGDV